MQHGQGPGAAGMLHAAVVVVDGMSDVADDDGVDDELAGVGVLQLHDDDVAFRCYNVRSLILVILYF